VRELLAVPGVDFIHVTKLGCGSHSRKGPNLTCLEVVVYVVAEESLPSSPGEFAARIRAHLIERFELPDKS